MRAHGLLDSVEQLCGTQPVRTNIARLAFNLLFDSGYANLEKLIKIRAENREEFNPLNERLRGVLRFLEDALIEREPAQLPVDKILRIAKTVVEGLDNLRNSGRIAFLFSARSGLGLRHVLTIAE